MLKDLMTPETANVFIGKLGDILEKAIGKPLGYALNWGRIRSPVGHMNIVECPKKIP